MGKDKLRRWRELETYDFVFQPSMEEIFRKDYRLKGQWHQEVFRNGNPLVLELGCGKGEYTTGLAEMFPGKNFLGIDIKGARMWRGARTAAEGNLGNVAFLRTRIEFINSFFAEGEVDEIWITFPDPQPKKRQAKKRLCGPQFLNRYRHFLKPEGVVHLKTDNRELFERTMAVVKHNGFELLESTDNLYDGSYSGDMLLSIKTHYEKIFLAEGLPITYMQFRPMCDADLQFTGDENSEGAVEGDTGMMSGNDKRRTARRSAEEGDSGSRGSRS